MRALFQSLLGYFLTPAGLFVMAALDSSLVFFLPLGIDFVVIILVARRPDLFWLYPVLATAGSLVGSAVTFWIGRILGEHGLTRLVRPSRLKRVQQRVTQSAALSIGALAVIPPPFPFTAFVLTSGALGVDVRRFFLTLAASRIVRFAIESWLARHYGRGIVAWMKTETFAVVVGALAILAVIGTTISVIAALRGPRRQAAEARS
jgi:membrane protein YqaA with SNARE-associated domain